MWKRKLSFKRKGPRPTRRQSQPLIKSFSLPETNGVARSSTPPLHHAHTEYHFHDGEDVQEPAPVAVAEGDAVDVVMGDDDVIQAILRRKDSDLENMEVPDLDVHLKKNSIIRFKEEEVDDYLRRVGGCSVCERKEARRATAGACPLCASDVRTAGEEVAGEGAGESEAAPEGRAAGSLRQENGDGDLKATEVSEGESHDDREESHDDDIEVHENEGEEGSHDDEGKSRSR
ncbi:uncharacterized protein LOC122267027 isoform X1 [Penaeus japonicus]|uniref:uncharacterized protein LOC122267027 isoform X1 n=1 Tax=Penaeus japonicus TaxID=27405 RepID=UPI001C7178D1|nr:uncharacterized protein LOC122267027 isoform X1 [Penaeus japonicus]